MISPPVPEGQQLKNWNLLLTAFCSQTATVTCPCEKEDRLISAVAVVSYELTWKEPSIPTSHNELDPIPGKDSAANASGKASLLKYEASQKLDIELGSKLQDARNKGCYVSALGRKHCDFTMTLRSEDKSGKETYEHSHFDDATDINDTYGPGKGVY